ncbi:hypothetical protein B0P06_000569 [Clostridium saccharoperbutylacetonicum]|nr:hypothetical protein [Clostridium saccharoperbutylacetonicum]
MAVDISSAEVVPVQLVPSLLCMQLEMVMSS